jgi:hypothetical protein
MQQLVAVEYRPCPALGLLMPAGIKLLLVNPAVRRGMLLLQPENVVVLGGVVSTQNQPLAVAANSSVLHAEVALLCVSNTCSQLAAAGAVPRCVKHTLTVHIVPAVKHKQRA